MDAIRLGEELLALCKDGENKYAEVVGLLESLSQDERHRVVRYRDKVGAP